MKKIVAVFLFALTLLLSSAGSVYAAEKDYTYSSYVDEIAGIEKPYWSFDYTPLLSYKYEFLIFKWGDAKTIGWDIDTVSFYFTKINQHEGEFLVGYNLSDMDITFEYCYDSVDESLKHYSSSKEFTYALTDCNITVSQQNYVEFNFAYEDILAGCDYWSTNGYDTVLKSVEVFISSRILKTNGTIMHYEFSADEDYSKQIYTGIEAYKVTGDDIKLLDVYGRSFKDSVDADGNVGDGNGFGVELHHFVVVYPGTLQEEMFDINDVVEDIVIELPKAAIHVFEFLVDIFLLLPEYMITLFPFFPESVIYLLWFVVIASILFKIFGGLISSLKKVITSGS